MKKAPATRGGLLWRCATGRLPSRPPAAARRPATPARCRRAGIVRRRLSGQVIAPSLEWQSGGSTTAARTASANPWGALDPLDGSDAPAVPRFRGHDTATITAGSGAVPHGPAEAADVLGGAAAGASHGEAHGIDASPCGSRIRMRIGLLQSVSPRTWRRGGATTPGGNPLQARRRRPASSRQFARCTIMSLQSGCPGAHMADDAGPPGHRLARRVGLRRGLVAVLQKRRLSDPHAYAPACRNATIAAARPAPAGFVSHAILQSTAHPYSRPPDARCHESSRFGMTIRAMSGDARRRQNAPMPETSPGAAPAATAAASRSAHRAQLFLSSVFETARS
jgi:hypothetical protein